MKFFRASEGKGRWYTPFPDDFPDFKIEILRLSNEQIVTLADKWRTSKPGTSSSEKYNFWRETCEQSVLNWEGAETLFKALFPDVTAFDCSKASKKVLMRSGVIECDKVNRTTGEAYVERESLWQHLDHWTADQEAVELKN
ncbi:MAG TPA: hypothetical protein PLB01_00325 [Thermoanaerobaculia bacterium]|nr:hypothetical protein [Thermoanaerobaculia bacterium]